MVKASSVTVCVVGTVREGVQWFHVPGLGQLNQMLAEQPMVQSDEENEDDEQRRDSLQPFASPSVAPTGAQQFAAAQLPGVNIAQDPTHAWIGNNPQYFGDNLQGDVTTSEQSGSGERSHVMHTII